MNINKTRIEQALNLANRSSSAVLGAEEGNGGTSVQTVRKITANKLKEFWISMVHAAEPQLLGENIKHSLFFYDENTFEGLMLTGEAEEISIDGDSRKMKMLRDILNPDETLIRFTATSGSYFRAPEHINCELKKLG